VDFDIQFMAYDEQFRGADRLNLVGLRADD
jgi:hypothetical protein